MAVEAVINHADYDQETGQYVVQVKLQVTPPDVPPKTWTLPVAAGSPAAAEPHHKKSKKK